MLFRQTFADGLDNLIDALTDARTSSPRCMLTAAGRRHRPCSSTWCSASTISILLVRYEFPGKRVLSALIDVPLSVSPVVVGLALLLVYNGRDGWFGPALEERRRPGHLRRRPG